MKRTLFAAAGLALAAACGVASAASWSIVVEPGVYGRVAIGGYAQAPLVYDEQPVVAIGDGAVVPQAVEYGDGGVPVYSPPAYDQTPVYLWVPEWQRVHWADACRDYGACGVPVYFVQDGWYRDNVMHRAWTPEQRSWTQAQWIEQDRFARERWERDRWNRERGWREQQQWRVEQQRSQGQWQHDPRRSQEQWQRAQQPASWDHARDDRGPDRADFDRQARERADRDLQDRQRWQQARGQGVQPVAAWQGGQRPQPGDRNDGGYGGWHNGGSGGDGAGHDHSHGGGQGAGASSGQFGNPAGARNNGRGNVISTGPGTGQGHAENDGHNDGRGDDRGHAGGPESRDGRGGYQHGPIQGNDR